MKSLQFPSLVVAAGLVFNSAWLGRASAEGASQLGEHQREVLTAQKRDETIEQLRRIIPKIDDRSAQKADLLYQLAELYVEKAKHLLREEMSQYDRQIKSYEQARKRGEARAEPKANHRESESYRVESLKLYDRIRREYPKYERKGEVLFALAYNLYETGRKEEAIARYEELIQADPKSAFVADTYLQLGNHYFDIGNDLSRARRYYQKALRSDLPKVHSYALYKLSWCDYNAGEFENALKKLQQVVAFAQTHGREMVDLRNEALGDMTAVFVRLGRFEDALDYFQSTAPPAQQRKLIARLANQLVDTGQYDSAIRVYRHLIARAPSHPDAPEYQQSIVRCYEGLRDRAQVKSEIRRLVELYRPGSEWWKANEGRPEILRNAFAVSEEGMRTLAVDYHQEAQRTKQVETYRLARDIYAQYAQAFASSSEHSYVSDQALNMRFYYAEVLWALEDWENAAQQYEEVIHFKVPDRESAREVTEEKFRKTAAYNVVLAYDRLVKIERGELAKSDLKSGRTVGVGEKSGLQRGRIEKKSAKGGQQEPLSQHEAQLVAACDRYNRLYPGDPNEVELQYLAAIIHYHRKHFQEAVERFEQIANRWPEDNRSQSAADLAMYVLESREDWQQLNRLSRRFLRNSRLAKPGTEFARRIANVVEGSQYKWVDEVIYRKEKNPAKAAQEFVRLADEFPRSKYAARALTYAAIAFGEAQQLAAGIAAGERVLNGSRGSPFEVKVRFTLARYYEKIADFEKAARMYESFVAAYDRRTPDGEREGRPRAASHRRPNGSAAAALDPEDEADERTQLLAEAEKWIGDAAFNAGLWWEALGQYERAIMAYCGYLARFKRSKDAPEVKYSLGSLYEKSNRWAEALKTYREFETEYANDKRVNAAQHYLAKYRRLLALRRLGSASESDRLLDQLIRDYGKLKPDLKQRGDVQEAYATARFWKVEPLWKEYTQLRFTRVATIRRDLEAKRRKLIALEKAYTEVLAIGSADHGIAALTRIGLAYLDLAQNITGSPDPPGLTQEQVELYRAELKNLAAPLDDKAVEALEKGVVKASELGVYNEWVLAAQDNINKIRPGTYAKAKAVPYRSSAALAAVPLQSDSGAIAAAIQSPRALSTGAGEGGDRR